MDTLSDILSIPDDSSDGSVEDNNLDSPITIDSELDTEVLYTHTVKASLCVAASILLHNI